MADFRTTLGINTSEYDSGLESSKRKTKEFQDAADKASDSVKDLGKKSKSTASLLSEIGKAEGGARSVSNYRQQLMKLTKEIQDLTINYRNMSSEMKNSDLGRETQQRIQELTIKAGQYKDAIMDAQQSIRALASDTATWDSMKQGIDVVSSSVQALAASGVLGEKSTEKLVEVIAKLRAIEVSTNAVIKIGNALQKQSALMMGISTIQAKALAAAKSLETKNTIAAAAAQKIFNTIAKANPYVLLASVIIAAASALALYTKRSKENKEALKKQEEEQKRAKDAYDDYVKDISEKSGDLLSKYKLLQIQWSKLNTVSDKSKWIKQNKNEFENLGLKVNDVISAENTFVRNTGNIVEALKKRALAAAKQAQMTELYKKMMEAQQRADDEYNRRKVSTGSKVGGSGHSTAGGNEYVDRNGAWVYTEKGAKEANKRIYNETHATVNKIQGDIDALAKSIAADMDPSSFLKNTTTTTTETIQAAAGSLQAAQNEANRLQTILNNMSPDNPEFEKTKAALKSAKEEVERLQKIISDSKPIDYVNNSLEEANHFVQVFQSQLQSLDPESDEFKEVVELLNIWKKRVEEINGLINQTGKEQKTILEEYKDIVSSASDVSLKFKIGAITKADADKLINDLNSKLEGLGLSARVKLEIDPTSYKTTAQKMKDFVSTMDKVGSLSSAVSSINSVYESISGLSDKLRECTNGWEAFFAVFESGVEIFNTVTTIIEALSTATEILTGVKEAHAAATTKEALAATTDAAAQSADAAASTTAAAAHGAAGAAKAGESVASIPYVGPVLAVAAIVAVMAAILSALSSAQSFSSGGVVGGSSFSGDKIIARLNSGEVVLNEKQQNRLMNILSDRPSGSSVSTTGEVEFKINGTQLVGVLNNVNKKMNKV